MNKIGKILLLFSLLPLKFADDRPELWLSEGQHRNLQTSKYTSKGFLLMLMEVKRNDNIRVNINSNDINFSVNAQVSDDRTCDINTEDKHAEITFKCTSETYFEFTTVSMLVTINAANYATYEIYFETYKTAGEIVLTIFIVLICIGVVIGLIFVFKKYVYPYYLKEKRKELEKKERLIKKREEGRNCVDIFYEIIKENPDRLNMICPICFIDKNGKHINNEEYNSIILNEYDGDTEDYKNDLIQGIKSGKITKIRSDFLKVKKKPCKHFHHEECKKKKKNFRCNFCYKNMTPENIKAFHPISKDEFKSGMSYYTKSLEYFKEVSYTTPLINSILDFIDSSDEISQEIKNKIKKARELTRKFINKDLRNSDFELGYNDDLDYYENKYYKELEEKEEEEERERMERIERERERREMENNRNQQPREMSLKSSTSGKKEKVDCLSCSDCMGHCVFCFASCPKAGGYKAHKSCYSDKKCVICKNKKGQFTVIGKCTKCGSKGSKYYNKCFICGELL